MGIRGRKPKPTAVKLATGNPGHRPLNLDEPQPTGPAPDPPEWLEGEGLKRWQQVAPELEKLGLLTANDGGALAQYCTVWARWLEAEEKIRKFGQVVKSPRGYLMQSPYISLANKALSHLRALEEQFGMTPSSRSRVKVSKVPGKNTSEQRRERFFGIRGGKVNVVG